MLSQILVRYMVRYVAVFAGVATILIGLVFGSEHAPGVVYGALLISLSVGALIFVVGRLLDPTVAGSQKGLFGIALFVKIVVIAGLLWKGMADWGFSGLGIIFGVGAGLLGIVLGLNAASASDEGKRAIEEHEARIREEMGDSDDDSR